MNNDQIKIISERVVEEVFHHIFSDDEEVKDGMALVAVACSGRRKLPADELSRRLDAAIALSAEKLKVVSRAL